MCKSNKVAALAIVALLLIAFAVTLRLKDPMPKGRDPRMVGRWRGLHDTRNEIGMFSDGVFVIWYYETRMLHGKWGTDGQRVFFEHFFDEEGERSFESMGYGFEDGRLVFAGVPNVFFGSSSERTFQRVEQNGAVQPPKTDALK